jgi:tape measure domain-containing protein
MAKQVSEILVKLGIQGLQGLDKLKSSFRELEKSLGPSAATIERARESIIAFGKEGRNTEQVIKGQIEALRGLQSQTERGSTAWAELAGDIERFRQASRRTDSEIQILRQSILSVATGANQSQQSLRSYITDLGRLRGEATITGSVFNDLGRDIAELTTKLQQAETQTIQTSRAFGRVLGQALASTSAGARKQLQDLKLLVNEQREIVDSIDQRSAKERRLQENIDARAAAEERLNRALVQQRQLMYGQSVRAGRESVRTGAAAFAEGSGLFDFRDAARRFGDLPDTTAALNQELAELSERLLNTNRSSSAYVDVSNRMAQVQRELRTELTGTASTFDQLARSQAAASRQMSKRAAIQEYYAPGDLLAPGVGGYRDPRTGAMIAGGAGPARIGVQEAAYPTPIGPQPFPEMGRRAQESIERAMDDVNRIYEDARVRRVEIQSKYDQIQIDKMLEGLDLEGRVREKGFKDELAAFDRQLEIRDRKRRGRLTTGQAVQSAGAIISGGIFGGPEGFLGGLGGFAAGLAIPGLGPVGGAFAGAAGGAQVGGLRQAAGAAAEYAAEIRRLQLALQGVVYSFDDYRAALKAIESTSEQFNIPVLQSTQQFTKLSAAVIGSGGSIKDAENTFKGLAASVLATGGSIQDVNGALVAAAQVFSKGKVSAEELRGQIGERLAGAFALFAESSGKSTKELDADLQAGEVTLDQFVQFVEFSLKKYGRTAQIIADSPEQAGARLDQALKNLQKDIGDALGPSGAAFQDFAARSIRGLDRLIDKLIELRAVQPGAGYYQEQVLTGGMSIEELEKRVLEAGSRESVLRESLGSVGLGFLADLRPEVQKASKEVKILEEALIKLRLIEKETNKERKQRQDDETKAEKEKLGQQYLQAVEQREEALFDARRQREEQIAQIRKNAIEQAAQIERQLADERRNIERDMERVRREMQAGSGEIDRLRRLAEGEDPRVIEAERAAAQISQEATEDRIKAEEDLLDKELQQQRTIADFQKNTAKQIADANENYAKRVGEIQGDFAKASAKIIEEGSGRAAKRITLAAQIVSQVLQRTSLNQQRTQFGLQPIAEPSKFVGSRPVYGDLQPGEVPEQIKRIDQNLEQLLRKLSAPQGNQGSLPSFRTGSRANGIGEQFISLLQNERGYEDVAGLLPLPIQRMQQQAARPLRMIWQQIQGAMEGVYGATERQIKKQFKPDPVRNQQVLQRVQKTQEAILNWNPLEAQWKETENQMREQKRSKPSRMPVSSFVGMTRDIHEGMLEELRRAGALATRASERSFFDFSDFVSPQQQQMLSAGIKEALSAAMDQSFAELRQVSGGSRDPSMMPAFESAIRRLSPVINRFRELFQGVLSQEAASGHRYAQEAMKKFGMQAPVNEQFYRSPAYRDPGLIQERLDRLYEQPRIQHGVESQFEGAMLPGGSFNVSRLARNFGNIASASTGSPLQYFPAIAQNIRGAAPTTQLRQQSTQQRFEQIDQQALIKAYEVMSQVKSSSAQTLENFKLQNREIELQIQNLSDGMEPELASQLSGLQSNYEVQQQQLEIQRQALINQGLNAEAVNQAYAAESEALARIYEQNQAAIAQYREKQKILEAIQNTSTILESNLTSAISNSIQVLVTGSGTVKQVLADMFKSIGQAFIQMAAQIIAKQLVMVALGSIMKALGLAAGPSSGTFDKGYFDPATGLGAAGPNFGLAKGGYFANGAADLPANSVRPFAMGGIVTKPTFFKFANGGTMSNGVMGEAGPEAIMPLKRGADGKLGVAARLDGAMKRYRSTPGSAAAAAEGDAASLAAAGAATMEPIDVRYSVERINSVDYVTADQFQAGMAQAAQQGALQGERRAMRSLKNSSATRRSVGI